MAVSTIEAGVLRLGDGVNTVFDFEFAARDAADIKVSNVVDNNLVPVLSGFTVTLEPGNIGGKVTYSTPPVNNQQIYIYRDTPATQLVSVSAQEKYDPTVTERVWDKLTFLVQELKTENARSLKLIPGINTEDLMSSILNAGANAEAAAASASEAAVYDPNLRFSRNLRAVLDAAEPINGIPDGPLVIEKRRTDFIEYAVFSPIERTGIEWIRHFSSVRLLPGAVGAPDYTVGTLAYLYASTALALFGATGTTGITAASPTATVNAASATSRTGTWTGPVTVNSVANTFWTTTTGDSVVYTITVPAGGLIYHEAPAVFSNGGIAEVVVRLSGVEITAGEYLCPLSSGVRIADYRVPNGTLAVIPLAKVTAAGTYTVTLTRSAQSPASGRLYDTRVEAFNPIAFNAPGVYGAVVANSDAGSLADLSFATGTTIVYQCTNTTRIGFRYWRNTVCGQVQFRVFNNSGIEIGSYVTSTVDMFGSSLPLEAEVCRGLARGTYWLHVTVLTTRNASATDYRMYARGPVAYDETTAGTVGTHAFDILDMPASPSTSSFGTNVLIGPGNHWYASQWRPSSATSWPGGDNFVSGVHGEETPLTNADLTVRVDGVTVAWNAAAQFATFTGREIVVEFSTTLNFPGTATPFATLARKITYRRGGVVLVETTRTLTANATMGEDYIAMLQSPNGGNNWSSGVGGGFANWAAERSRNFLLNTSAGVGTGDNPWSEVFACWNGRYANYVALLNSREVLTQYAAQIVGTSNVLMQDNASHFAKAYLRSAGGSQPTTGVTFSSGHVSRVVKVYRTLPCRDADVLCAS